MFSLHPCEDLASLYRYDRASGLADHVTCQNCGVDYAGASPRNHPRRPRRIRHACPLNTAVTGAA